MEKKGWQKFDPNGVKKAFFKTAKKKYFKLKASGLHSFQKINFT